MAKNMQYYKDVSNSRHEKARLLLQMFSPDMVRDIVELVTYRGDSVVNDVFPSGNEADASHPLAILSREYIKDEYFPSVLTGLNAIILSNIRQPRWGQDEYATVLSNAFSLPPAMAADIASKIETLDPTGGGGGAWSHIGASVREGVRRFLNWLPSLAAIPWEMDQNQNYDIDFLYELARLGDAVDSLKMRGSLMSSQAAIQITTGWLGVNRPKGALGTGDPALDEAQGDVEMGGILSLLALSQLPKMITGVFGPLISRNTEAIVRGLGQGIQSKGLNVDASGSGDIYTTGAGDPNETGDVVRTKKLLMGQPNFHHKIGAAFGVKGKRLLPVLRTNEPAVREAAADRMDHEFGEGVGDAWQQGDIMSIIKNILGEADQSLQSSPLSDADIAAVAQSPEAGDVVGMTPEVGGIFSRIISAHQKKKAQKYAYKTAKRRDRFKKKTALKRLKYKSEEADAQPDEQPNYDDYAPSEEADPGQNGEFVNEDSFTGFPDYDG